MKSAQVEHTIFDYIRFDMHSTESLFQSSQHEIYCALFQSTHQFFGLLVSLFVPVSYHFSSIIRMTISMTILNKIFAWSWCDFNYNRQEANHGPINMLIIFEWNFGTLFMKCSLYRWICSKLLTQSIRQIYECMDRTVTTTLAVMMRLENSSFTTKLKRFWTEKKSHTAIYEWTSLNVAANRIGADCIFLKVIIRSKNKLNAMRTHITFLRNYFTISECLFFIQSFFRHFDLCKQRFVWVGGGHFALKMEYACSGRE